MCIWHKHPNKLKPVESFQTTRPVLIAFGVASHIGFTCTKDCLLVPQEG